MFGQTERVFLIRVALPDRPGSLGAVATAMGAVRADINAVEIVEKLDGYAVDDFMVELPTGVQPDALVTACTSIEGVQVLWLSFHPTSWGLQADVDLLDDMTENPERAEVILTEQAPAVLRAHWAMMIDRTDGRVVARTELAPEVASVPLSVLGRLDVARTGELAEDWLPGWPETLIAVAPFKSNRSVVIARKGGPEFIKSEVARLRHLAVLAK